MKDFYIVKKSVKKRDVFKPKELITIEEYQNFVENHPEFTWLEYTEHGKEWEKVRPLKKN